MDGRTQAPPAVENTIFVQALTGGITVGPKQGRELLFGRNRPEVHVCVGEDDPQVSRHHGTLFFDDGSWCVRTTGRTPIRFPDRRMLFESEPPIPLAPGYTLLFVTGSSGREHALEIRVSGPDRSAPVRPDDHTRAPRTWPMDATEHLVLVALARRYLQHEPQPAPQSWRQVEAEVARVQPDAGWTHRRVEHLVTAIRARLSKAGVPGLTREEWGDPVGNALNESLISELLRSTTIIPTDLALLDADPAG
ncbi:hypothetical protein EV383_4983 [Pseudonocardia sediminis]|uniref:FHA domain-containing protein n=1 Tax=Pseudonocardia sediminis TaxID=1397368 RepID=A0A4Q7V5U3_PSEST|nr:FHA domain-containing protein [Pseudonocardia sediminis]RZT88049.1 hypothetical protein EV383_4983 [Pseudonocardia sediminis]